MKGWVGWLGARFSRGPPHPRSLAPFRIARLQLEARDQELRQAEDQAQRAQEKQAWVQLKEQEVLQLQVGQGRGERGRSVGIGDSGELSAGSLLALLSLCTRRECLPSQWIVTSGTPITETVKLSSV